MSPSLRGRGGRGLPYSKPQSSYSAAAVFPQHGRESQKALKQLSTNSNIQIARVNHSKEENEMSEDHLPVKMPMRSPAKVPHRMIRPPKIRGTVPAAGPNRNVALPRGVTFQSPLPVRVRGQVRQAAFQQQRPPQVRSPYSIRPGLGRGLQNSPRVEIPKPVPSGGQRNLPKLPRSITISKSKHLSIQEEAEEAMHTPPPSKPTRPAVQKQRYQAYR